MLSQPPPSSTYRIAENEDLLAEILLRLPAKPLIRFKCVSKQWLALISSPDFCHRHTRRHSGTAVSGVFLRRTPSPTERSEFVFVSFDGRLSSSPLNSPDFVPDPAGIRILHSCNGLYLCSSFRGAGRTRSYYVYNPTTKQFVTLPGLRGGASTTVFGLNLAFEPSRSSNYKVVCVRSTVESLYYYQIEIYSSESRSWRNSGGPFVAPFDVAFDRGVFWNGAVHWIGSKGTSLYFDVQTERLQNMPTPKVVDGCGRRRFQFIGECCGHLHLIEIHGSRFSQFRLYEMVKDYSGWLVKYQGELDALVDAFPEMVRSYLHPADLNYYACVILSFVREEKEGWSLLLHIPGKVIYYNVKDKTYKKLCDLGPCNPRSKGSLQFGLLDAYLYIETLACV